MKKTELTAAVDAAKAGTKAALETVYNALNPGQQKQIVKDKAVRKLFDIYGVEYGE